MRVLIADDQGLFRDLLINFLSADPELKVEGVGSYPGVISETETDGQVDLLLLDYRLPGMNGLQGLRDAIQHQRGRRVVLMSEYSSHQMIVAALAAGAAGFIPKTLTTKSFLNAMKFVLSGEIYIPVGMSSAKQPDEVAYDNPAAKLSPRELAVLRLLGEGKVNRVIGKELGISEVAVKQFIKSIFRHLSITNRTQAAILARDLGLLRTRSNSSILDARTHHDRTTRRAKRKAGQLAK
jgi:two-component system, NarL family, nitrate/nitrite response regulator NarL